METEDFIIVIVIFFVALLTEKIEDWKSEKVVRGNGKMALFSPAVWVFAVPAGPRWLLYLQMLPPAPVQGLLQLKDLMLILWKFLKM